MPDHPTEQVDREAVIAEALQNHPAQDNWMACGCGEWGAWNSDGPNGCYEEHAAEAVCAALDAATLQCPTCGRTLNPQQRWCPKCLKWVVGERDQ